MHTVAIEIWTSIEVSRTRHVPSLNSFMPRERFLMVKKMAETVKGLGESIALLVEKLAGKGSNLELGFKDLTLEVAGLKAKINGSVVLNILYVSKEK